MELNNFYNEVLTALYKSEVEMLLVGGLAVGFYGHVRYTNDMDLWLNPTKENLQKLSKALKLLKYDDSIIDQILKERPLDHPSPIRLLSDDNGFKVDLMTNIYYDFKFEECMEKAENQPFEGLVLPVIGINHLIEIKQNVKRYDNGMKDLIDAQELRKILQKRSEKEIKKEPSFLKKIFKNKGRDKGMSM